MTCSKRIVIACSILLVLMASFAVIAQQPSGLSFSVGFTGTPNEFDVRAAKLIVDRENIRRAGLDPPVDPLPFNTGVEKKASYLMVLNNVVTSAHSSYMKLADDQTLRDEVVQLWKDATDAQRAAAIAALGG